MTLNRDVLIMSTKDEGRGNVSFVETFSMMKNSPYTDIQGAAHISPQYPASKLEAVIDLNRYVYVRNMLVELLNLIRLIK